MTNVQKLNYTGQGNQEFEIKTMSSREIAELTNKEHRNVLADCDKLNYQYLKMGLAEISAGVYTLSNTGSQQHRCYQLTKMQTIDLMTGYNIELRIKINRRWEELETQNKTPLSKEHLLLQAFTMLSDDVKRLEQNKKELECVVLAQERKLESKSAKEDFANRMIGQGDTVAVTVIAKRHGMTANALNKVLKEKGVQRVVSGVWVLNKEYQKKGYAKIVSKECHDGKFRDQLEWTLLGQAFIYNLLEPLKKDGYKINLVPLNENASFVN